MTTEPDYTKLPLSELRQIERYINPELVPERWARLQEAIAARIAAPGAEPPRPWRLFLARLEREAWHKVIAISQLLGAGLALLLVALALATRTISIRYAVGYLVGATVLTFVSLLLWREHPLGVWSSLLIQAAQCVRLRTGGIAYEITAGPNLPLAAYWSGSGVTMRTFEFHLNVGRANPIDGYLAINCIAVLATIVLFRRLLMLRDPT